MGGASDSAKKVARNTGIAAALGIDPSSVGQATATKETVNTVQERLNPPLPEVPSLPSPTAMPIPGQDTLEAVTARRRSIQAQLARRGRLSTILSSPQYEPLGG